MPTAVVAPLVGAGLSGAGGASAGKKGKNAAKQANQIAQQQFQLQSNIANQALGDVKPAASYFQALLSGDPTQIAGAVGPTSDILKGQQQSQAQQIAATTPSGGQQNIAQQQNAQNSYNQIARLYAGVQPQAAQALGSLGTGLLGIAAPNVAAGSKALQSYAGSQNQKAGQLGSGAGSLFGQGLYNAKQGKRSGSGSQSRAGSGVGQTGAGVSDILKGVGGLG